jgi:hypothetical protein
MSSSACRPKPCAVVVTQVNVRLARLSPGQCFIINLYQKQILKTYQGVNAPLANVLKMKQLGA